MPVGEVDGSFRIAARTIGGVSAIFVVPLLVIVALVAPDGLVAALWLGASYFGPLLAWLMLTARPAVLLAAKQKGWAFGYSALSVALAITSAWIVVGLAEHGFDATALACDLAVSLPSLGFLYLLGIPVAVLAGIFFVGAGERARQ
ncbi:hypothetical protein [Arenimonas metalli]|uniref:Uncharacterized protein n=1 Tax=Arenimonas metalli CF5-1 TaxID=1384056 RepID=A0A091B2J5_9GAMM|nr:hypothetical protein [Arenimonas metalli]KFN45782.1 hypothetical protein N787_12025 [Arenimonas metalli CF5-1]